jgi:hypothetical protein
MLRLTNPDNSPRRNWISIVVLLAIAALTVSLATRYASVCEVSAHANAAQKDSTPQHAKQRLIKTAASWIPPVVSAVIIQSPSAYPRIAPAGPPIPRVLFEKNLYNRPPPFLNPYFS